MRAPSAAGVVAVLDRNGLLRRRTAGSATRTSASSPGRRDSARATGWIGRRTAARLLDVVRASGRRC